MSEQPTNPEHRKKRSLWSSIDTIQHKVGLIACIVWLIAAGIHSYGAEVLYGIPLEATAAYAVGVVAVQQAGEFVRTSSFISLVLVILGSKMFFDYLIS